MVKQKNDPTGELIQGELSKIFESLSKKEAEAKQPTFDPQKHKDETRATIAKIFTWSFFGLLAIILIGVPIYNLFAAQERILDIKDTILVFSGVVGSPFGFVVGYYFKGSEE